MKKALSAVKTRAFWLKEGFVPTEEGSLGLFLVWL